ncbi:MAG TPA: hypothetical protein VK464_16440 [Symbiobacteriaceae bacterium]|nr:hypothetical protein [Symbiobacteriaceae bacterium]
MTSPNGPMQRLTNQEAQNQQILAGMEVIARSISASTSLPS